jgi:hypothetical protein
MTVSTIGDTPHNILPGDPGDVRAAIRGLLASVSGFSLSSGSKVASFHVRNALRSWGEEQKGRGEGRARGRGSKCVREGRRGKGRRHSGTRRDTQEQDRCARPCLPRCNHAWAGSAERERE